MRRTAFVLLCAGWWGALRAAEKPGPPPTPLDAYIDEAYEDAARMRPASRGSLFVAAGPLADLARDPRAQHADDLVTIVVVEQATALSRGATTSNRKSSNKTGITSLYGAASSRFANLVNGSGETQLSGTGTTSRETNITARLSARITDVLPNGYLVVEGNRDIVVNSERQLVTVRGVARPADLQRDNTIRSDRLAQMEIRINGKGVVNDAIRRPFFLYRLLLGILPF